LEAGGWAAKQWSRCGRSRFITHRDQQGPSLAYASCTPAENSGTAPSPLPLAPCTSGSRITAAWGTPATLFQGLARAPVSLGLPLRRHQLPAQGPGDGGRQRARERGGEQRPARQGPWPEVFTVIKPPQKRNQAGARGLPLVSGHHLPGRSLRATSTAVERLRRRTDGSRPLRRSAARQDARWVAKLAKIHLLKAPVAWAGWPRACWAPHAVAGVTHQAADSHRFRAAGHRRVPGRAPTARITRASGAAHCSPPWVGGCQRLGCQVEEKAQRQRGRGGGPRIPGSS